MKWNAAGLRVPSLHAITLLLLAGAAAARDSLETVLARIREPTFRAATYDVADFGAVGDGEHDDLPAFVGAIRQANLDQGGTVRAAAQRTYRLDGPLNLLSNVHVQLGERTTLRFSPDPDHYLPAVLTKFEGTELFNYSPLIRAYMSSNVALTGAGPSSLIDGSGEQWFGKASADTDKLRAMGNDSVPVYERVFGRGHKLPPNFVEPFGAVDVLLQGFTLTGSPFWTVHPVDSQSVTVRNLTVSPRTQPHTHTHTHTTPSPATRQRAPPRAGAHRLHQELGRLRPRGVARRADRALDFDTGDDAVAIKAGRDADGWRVGRPTENIVVRRNTMAAKTNGICIGSEMSGGVSNVYAYDNVVSTASAAIYFKSNLDRGSWVRDVDVWGTRAAAVSTCVEFTNGYHGARGGRLPVALQRLQPQRQRLLKGERLRRQRGRPCGAAAAGRQHHRFARALGGKGRRRHPQRGRLAAAQRERQRVINKDYNVTLHAGPT